MPLSPEDFYAQAVAAADAEQRLPLSRMAGWDISPFEPEGLRVSRLRPPVIPEPPRHGEDAADCGSCRRRDEGIWLLRYDELKTKQRRALREYFMRDVFPVLTPLAVDPSHPFPYISGLSINLAVLVKNPDTGGRQFARVKVPTVLPRFVQLDEDALQDEEVLLDWLGRALAFHRSQRAR